MSQRLRLYDVRTSRLFQAVGICQGDVMGTAEIVNSAQERLITAREAGETGWWGSWAHVAFDVLRTDPYITLPRELARIEQVAVCTHPVPIQNQFYEYLRFGIGPQDELRKNRRSGITMFDRGNVPTFVDLTNSPQIIRVRMEDSNDVSMRVLLQGEDDQGKTIVTQDGYNMVQGVFVSLDSPFVDAPMQFSKVTGVQKDSTIGPVSIYQADPTTAEEVKLLTMAGAELVSGYRRYYLNNTPWSCCGGSVSEAKKVQVSGMAKLELIPLTCDTDYLLIQSMEAIIAECQAIRYSTMDSQTADAKAAMKHRDAIRFLQGQLVHFLGKDHPAIQFKPFGSARLEHKHVGMI